MQRLTFYNSRLILQTALLFESRCAAAAYASSVSGMVVDDSGKGVRGLKVIVYPLWIPLHGRGTQSMLSADGPDVVTGTTGAAGEFNVSMPADNMYHVCMQGAPAPLLDLCAAEPLIAVSSGSQLSSLSQKAYRLLCDVEDSDRPSCHERSRCYAHH